MSIDEEWSNFLENKEDLNVIKCDIKLDNYENTIPTCTDIYISTKTKII